MVFFNIFFKTLGFFLATFIAILVIFVIFSQTNNLETKNYDLISGNVDSENSIFILNLNGPIVHNDSPISNLLNYNIISPKKVGTDLDEILNLNPKILIVSINSPGGTVSASNELYKIFKSFKEKSGSKLFFHTSELLASGGYWASLSGDSIYASYGSIIGSIGVKGPDWFYFNKPILISSGIFGQTIEVEEQIEIYSTEAGKSKDLFNLFRKPTKEELDHLYGIVNKINDDFIRIVSKSRKIETNIIRNEIGGLIFNSSQAKNYFLIDNEISLDELINFQIKESKFEDFKIFKINKDKNSLIDKLVSVIFYNKNYSDTNNLNLCVKIKTNIVSILSYSSVGC